MLLLNKSMWHAMQGLDFAYYFIFDSVNVLLYFSNVLYLHEMSTCEPES